MRTIIVNILQVLVPLLGNGREYSDNSHRIGTDVPKWPDLLCQ